jgi:hypothetical protein
VQARYFAAPRVAETARNFPGCMRFRGQAATLTQVADRMHPLTNLLATRDIEAAADPV